MSSNNSQNTNETDHGMVPVPLKNCSSSLRDNDIVSNPQLIKSSSLASGSISSIIIRNNENDNEPCETERFLLDPLRRESLHEIENAFCLLDSLPRDALHDIERALNVIEIAIHDIEKPPVSDSDSSLPGNTISGIQAHEEPSETRPTPTKEDRHVVWKTVEPIEAASTVAGEVHNAHGEEDRTESSPDGTDASILLTTEKNSNSRRTSDVDVDPKHPRTENPTEVMTRDNSLTNSLSWTMSLEEKWSKTNGRWRNSRSYEFVSKLLTYPKSTRRKQEWLSSLRESVTNSGSMEMVFYERVSKRQ